MADYLEKKRREVSNTIHKGVLRDVANLARVGKYLIKNQHNAGFLD
ncbi:hypothetical protein WA856_17775 [Klebsiella pneumoniae]